MEDRPGFIVPPPGLIPSRPPAAPPPADPVRPPAAPPPAPAPAAPGDTGRSLPAFLPPAPGPAPAPAREQWRLVLPGGHRIPVTGTLLLGRNPSASAHPGPADPVALDDPTSTVSKTHAAVEAVGALLRVTDLHSTNGVTVAAAGAETRATPGEPLDVPSGAELRLGEYRMRAERS